MKVRAHLSPLGLEQILEIKASMNKGRLYLDPKVSSLIKPLSSINHECIYMYNRDKTILYYSSMQQKDFINNLNIHYVTFNKHLKNGTYYLGKYLFTREPALTSKICEMSISDLALMLEKDRVRFNKNKPVNSLSKSVLLVDRRARSARRSTSPALPGPLT
jgi:hypothetical protein